MKGFDSQGTEWSVFLPVWGILAPTMEFGDGVRTLVLGTGVARGTKFLSDGDSEVQSQPRMLWCDGIIGDGNADWAMGTAYSGNQHRIKMTIFQCWLRSTTFSVWSCDTGDSCLRWGETGTWTRSQDVDGVPSKLILGLQGGTDQRICMRMGSDISLDLQSSSARCNNILCAVRCTFLRCFFRDLCRKLGIFLHDSGLIVILSIVIVSYCQCALCPGASGNSRPNPIVHCHMGPLDPKSCHLRYCVLRWVRSTPYIPTLFVLRIITFSDTTYVQYIMRWHSQLLIRSYRQIGGPQEF